MRSNASAPYLVAEGNPNDMFLFTRLLKSSGATNPLHIALTGTEAIELLERVLGPGVPIAFPVAAFVDVSLPRQDGFAVLAWIRGRSALDGLPVIMLAPTMNAWQVAESGRLGAQCHLLKYPSKPVFAQVLEAAAAFSPGRGGQLFDLPGNLLRRGPERP